MFKKVATLAAVCVPVFAATANATDVTGNLAVTASIAASCNLTVGPTINFGVGINSTATAINASSNVQVNCSTGTPYTVGIDNGQNPGITRRMANGANFLSYQLYSDAARTTIFNNVPVSTIGGTGTGVDQQVDIYAQIPSQITPATGTYNDTVVVTVRY